jgi:hypothetical protein
VPGLGANEIVLICNMGMGCKSSAFRQPFLAVARPELLRFHRITKTLAVLLGKDPIFRKQNNPQGSERDGR